MASFKTAILPSPFACYKETLMDSKGSLSPSILSKDFVGKNSLHLSNHKGFASLNHAHKAMKWWEKTLIPNMMEINSAQELVDTLSNSGDRLVILDFFSPGCGGCKSLHPKICQLAESNPNAIFVKVNHEELKTMCACLHIHVLPFFRFYRSSEGKLCSFSCTNSTVKKFKNALEKYGIDGCSLGPAKGLEESELVALASIGQISYELPLKPTVEGLNSLSKNMGFEEQSKRLVIA